MCSLIVVMFLIIDGWCQNCSIVYKTLFIFLLMFIVLNLLVWSVFLYFVTAHYQPFLPAPISSQPPTPNTQIEHKLSKDCVTRAEAKMTKQNNMTCPPYKGIKFANPPPFPGSNLHDPPLPKSSNECYFQ